MMISCKYSAAVKGYILAFIMVSGEVIGSGLRFTIDYPREDENGLVEGRMLLLLSQNDEKEPRLQISDNSTTGFVFGVDAIGKQPSRGVTVDGDAFGYPVSSLNDIPAGEYWVQGLIHKYETFNFEKRWWKSYIK